MKSIDDVLSSVYERDYVTVAADERDVVPHARPSSTAHVAELQAQMKAAAANLEFEKAASLRDRIKQLRSRDLGPGREPALTWWPCCRVAQVGAPRGAGVRPACSARSAAALVTRPFYYRDIIEQFDAIGVGSLTVVLLTGMFTGMVLALQSGFTLDQFGARSMVGRLVSASMVKELGPVLTGLMVAGRVGSGIAAELGSMMVTDQIAALRALGTDPIRKLVLPRILAGLVMVPLLTVDRRAASAWSAAGS